MILSDILFLSALVFVAVFAIGVGVYTYIDYKREFKK